MHSAPHPLLSPILLVGRGRVGGAMARSAAIAGIEARIAGRNRDELASLAAGCEVALLCVPDEEIPAAAASLATSAPDLRFTGHTSGATPLTALEPRLAAGASAFSLHPLLTIPSGDAELVGCPAAVAGSNDAALKLADELAERLGMRPFEVPEDARAAYHAAAAIASNFLVALEASAVELLEASGVADSERARELLTPLVLRTASNWAERGPQALTGPIARGDEETVERHRVAIAAEAPELIPLYEALAERTRAVAARAQEVPS